MKIEDYDFLKNYEQNLFTAYKLDYSRNLPSSVLKKMDEIYKSLFGKDSGLMNGCSKCALRDLKFIASAYFEYKESMDKVQEDSFDKINEESKQPLEEQTEEENVEEVNEIEQVENETEPLHVTNSK